MNTPSDEVKAFLDRLQETDQSVLAWMRDLLAERDGLRDQLAVLTVAAQRYRAATWKQRILEDTPPATVTAHNAAVTDFRFADAELAKLLGERTPYEAVPTIEHVCDDCSGTGYRVDADPLPSGEPGEPYQVQCETCDGLGWITRELHER